MYSLCLFIKGTFFKRRAGVNEQQEKVSLNSFTKVLGAKLFYKSICPSLTNLGM